MGTQRLAEREGPSFVPTLQWAGANISFIVNSRLVLSEAVEWQ